MFFYWSLAIVVLVLYIFSEFTKSVLNKQFLILFIFLLLFLFSAFRVNIGIDYDGHYLIYKLINSSNRGHEYYKLLLELNFFVLCKFFHFTRIGFPGVIFVMSFLTLYPIYYISKKENSAVILVLYFFIAYLISYALVRQFCGVSLALLGAYFHQKEGKICKGTFFLIMAGFFHTSLFFYFFVFVLGKYIKIDLKKTVIISLFIFVFLSFLNIVSVLGTVLKHTKYGYYFLLMKSTDSETQIGSGVGVIIRFFIYFIQLYFLYTVKERKNYRYNLCFIFLIISDLLSLKILIFLRLRYVFMGLSFYPYIYKNSFFRTNGKMYFLSSWLYFFILLFYILTFSSTVQWGNIPYQSIFLTPIKDLKESFL